MRLYRILALLYLSLSGTFLLLMFYFFSNNFFKNWSGFDFPSFLAYSIVPIVYFLVMALLMFKHSLVSLQLAKTINWLGVVVFIFLAALPGGTDHIYADRIIFVVIFTLPIWIFVFVVYLILTKEINRLSSN